MGTPARTNILLEIKSALEAITVANGFNTDVATVEPIIRSRDDVNTGERPYLGFGAGTEDAEHFCFQDMKITMPVTIVGYLDEPSDWTTRSAALNLLIDDIIAKLSEDPSLNSNAISLYFVDWQTDEPDPDAGASAGAPGGGTIVVRIKIPYERTINAT